MYPYQGESNYLVFVHIPKTGGYTIKHLYLGHNKARVKHFDGAGKRDGEGGNGHIAFNPNINAKYFTVLRDPITRYWSHYWQYRKLRGRRKHPVQWILEDNPDNIVSAYLTGRYDSTFEQVIECLKKYIYIGEFENFDKSYLDISSILGLENPKRFWCNKGKLSRNREIPIEFIDIVKQKNKIDLKVYDWCKGNIW